MKAEHINPFLASTLSAFETMLGCGLSRGTPYVKTGATPEHEVSGVIGLSGNARGTVVLGLSREARPHADPTHSVSAYRADAHPRVSSAPYLP